ncbi:hypothetical protein QNA27_11860 [Pantoea eucalypti]|uniref:hypothetical protein n=1 Tax=Pantoea eucalypti TaxID=470933 RepID=UPI0024BA5D95|nr:hypothetical protein [Pantoea eucalypti]MDJ0474353.1 hypothetical protein [Pantoea eucalypti]
MDRQIVYPGAVPLETDLLNTNKFAMIGLAKLASAVLGSDTCLAGLNCTPASPVSLQVHISAGEIYCLQHIDEAAYSTLPADHSGTILKQGLTGGVNFDVPAPMQNGMSINYLVQAAYVEEDTGGIVLPFYNAADPSKAFNGQGNAGEALPCVRQGICSLSLKAGTSAVSGKQTTPEADPGCISAWIITVTAGTKGITADNIKRSPGVPFLPSVGVYRSVQQGNMTFAHDTGSANAYAASYQPPVSSLVDGMRLTFKAREPNTGKSVFSAKGGEAHPLLSQAKNELQGGEITTGGFITVEWDSAAQVWLMCGNTGGAFPVPDAVKAGHAVNLGQGDGRYLKKGEGYSDEQAKQTFLPLTGGKLSGSLTVKEDLKAEKDVKAANLYAGDALYDCNGDVCASHWRNREDGANSSRGWLTKWLKEKFSDLDDKYLSLKGGTVKGVLTVTEGIRIGTAKDKKEDKTKEIQTEITTKGDISGDKWNGKLSEWLNQKYKEQSEAISERPKKSEFGGLLNEHIRLSASTNKSGRNLKHESGYVMTQFDAKSKLSSNYTATFRAIQIDVNGAGDWKVIGHEK